ncbi:hypothetical protein ACWGH5_33750 [Streptomyces sp. NPDC054864]
MNGAVGELARAGLVAGAVSMFAVAWWCARYWYAAFCQGRRAEPVPDPNPWPWVLPWTVAVAALFVTGVRQLVSGDHAGWFSLGVGTFMTMPVIVGGVAALWGAVRASRRRTQGRTGAATSPQRAEPVRPRRDWGPIG